MNTYYITAIVTALVVSFLGYRLHSWDVDRIEAKHIVALKAQADEINTQCATAKAITEGISHDFENEIDSLDRDIARSRGLLSDECVTASFALDAAAGYHAPAAEPKLPQGNGRAINAGKLLDLAGRAEKTRIQLKACQAFISADHEQPKGKRQR